MNGRDAAGGIALEGESSAFEHAGRAGKHGRTATHGIDPLDSMIGNGNSVLQQRARCLRSMRLRHCIGAFFKDSKCAG